MKCVRFLSGLVLSAVLMSLLILPQQVFATTGGVVPGGGTDSSSQLSSRCQTILADGAINAAVDSDVETITGTSTTSTANPNDLYVFLSESITGESGATYSCSDVVECLRQKYRGQSSRLREVNVFNDVKSQFKQCIVTGTDGLDLLTNYASNVYQWIAGIVGGICVLVIVISGIQISIGGLSQEEVSTAKDRVVRSLVGLVVLFLSAFILYTINPVFFT